MLHSWAESVTPSILHLTLLDTVTESKNSWMQSETVSILYVTLLGTICNSKYPACYTLGCSLTHRVSCMLHSWILGYCNREKKLQDAVWNSLQQRVSGCYTSGYNLSQGVFACYTDGFSLYEVSWHCQIRAVVTPAVLELFFLFR